MAKAAENISPIEGTSGTRYDGAPCPTHGTTERYVCNKACVSCSRANHARRGRYGLSQSQIDLLLVAQGGCCAICRAPESGHTTGWHVDHDHATGAARGVLCHGCNVGLGFFKDSADNLRSAADYLNSDVRSARLFLVREIEYAIPNLTVAPRERAADVTGRRPPTSSGRFGKRPESAVPREQYLARRRETYRLRMLRNRSAS